MAIVTPCIHFRGRCEEALRLYQAALGLQVDFLLHYRDADARDGQAELLPERAQCVYHAEGHIGTQRLMFADEFCRTYGDDPPVFLGLTFDTAEEVRAAFAALSDGATVVYPLHSTTYSSCVGSLIDRFGIRWGLMTEQTER